ncbi:hypothetical protein ASPWEDRAFT_177063 [Aspergillus wentii DTO 134E9]|uniref:M-phase inducer phosphatase n=1 Tax=Aspergillus wentii DTO 134E9 TaxID=1073089 RepID=A0A1L9R699_ASPWE|nr:uncharacterized protein ASPWEDRAFT_177063 [Aspergillus wentii DTO 134E9]KAI9926921.1 cell division cycle 25 [Aspergillus wentii]OJJ30407.1 hypothetical protein ASPWEDRAFT_177063 [Aspergillus wentii DTO 134E9]
MEHSSPLAAMQPPSVMFGHCFRSDVPSSYGGFGPRSGFNPNSFNFKDLSMKKGDYFNMKPVRGSSPTASLAADLSQNFHIDQSPQLATPRRSLFCNNLFGPGKGREDLMTTPPLQSSPAPAMEIMDMSPLPHKPPFIVTTDVDLQSPTPDVDSPMRSAAASPLQDSPMGPPREGLYERKRPTFLRPSLAKSKAQSFQLGMTKPAPESQAPPFRFQSRGKTSMSASTSLEDMFGESPQRERPLLRNNSSGSVINNSRLRPPMNSHARGSGSPASGSIRKSSHPLMRPRKQCRRSLSMFEHPEEVIEKEANYTTTNAPLQSITDIEGTPSLSLPHFVPEDQSDTLPRINKATLVELMDGKFNERFDQVMVIDCRFEYEYEGGHINGAVNYNDKEYLAAELFAAPKQRTALILHCEYSAHRAPIMAKYIRHRDRAVNIDHYPHLTYPELYILDGGYSAFFAEHRVLCFPQNYVEMNAKEHEYACERGLGKVKQRSKLNRAQTFAFGQQSPEMEDSPTGRCRNNAGDRNRYLDSPFGDTPTSNRFSGRRMLSY